MTRLVLIAIVVLAAGGAVLAGAGSDSSDTPTYKVALDNSFGLTEGADLKSAGVRIGSIAALDVDRETAGAIVTVEVERPEFEGFRTDVFCEVQPQSLIGEYFLTCDPGTEGEPLPDGATIPVEQTAGTIPADLVQNILRRPARERFGLILAELGIGFAARGEDVQKTLLRAVPALRETDRVLKILADNRQTLQDLTRESDTVLGALAGNKEDVARFVAEARDTASASADRRDELQGTVRRLPAFLRGLRGTLDSLGDVAREQTPALADLRASAPALTTLFDRLGPFAEASRPAIRSLGDASLVGRRAVREAADTTKILRELGQDAEEPLRNLRFALEHVDDPANGVEPNDLAPNPEQGFTGLEALLQYPFVQSQAINIFDSRGYILKLNALINECGAYTDAETAREEPERTRRCSQALGPNQPGITTPDPSPAAGQDGSQVRRAPRGEDDGVREQAPREQEPGAEPAPAPSPRRDRDPVGDLLDRLLPGTEPPRAPALPGGLDRALGGGREERTPPPSDSALLDFLLGP